MKIKTKSKKVNKAWLNDHVNDPYVKLAQKEGYRARAAYKLKEIGRSIAPDPAWPDRGGLGQRTRGLEPVSAAQTCPARSGDRRTQWTHYRTDILCRWSLLRCRPLQGDFREETVWKLQAVTGKKADVVVSDMVQPVRRGVSRSAGASD